MNPGPMQVAMFLRGLEKILTDIPRVRCLRVIKTLDKAVLKQRVTVY